MLLELEVAAARSVGLLSRVARRGGGTTLPGKLLSTVDPTAVDRLAASLPRGSVLVSATNGKTTTTSMVARIVGPELGDGRLAHNHSGANLLSGIASTLLSSRGAELGLFEVDEAALPGVARRVQPRLVALGNLFRDQLDRYGELEHIAERWRDALSELPAALLVVNADDPLLGELARGRDRTLTYGLDDPRHRRQVLQHAADSKYCRACGAPYVYAAAYVGHLGDYRCTGCGLARLPLEVAASDIELHGLDAASFTLTTPGGTGRVTVPLPGLYNVYNATAAAAVAHSLEVPFEAIVGGLERSGAAFGRAERITVGDRRVLMLLVKNPAGANEALRTLLEASPPRLAVVALNDEIADGRDVSWIWDVDFEPFLETLDHVVVAGTRAAELALRFTYGGLGRERIEVVPELESALDRGLSSTPAGGELVVLPTYTAMLALRGIVARRGHVPDFWQKPA
jgi:lipid II isoglutaminyl synthase (glutamine-hydrolysing)